MIFISFSLNVINVMNVVNVGNECENGGIAELTNFPN
jgi:hypothetical protein